MNCAIFTDYMGIGKYMANNGLYCCNVSYLDSDDLFLATMINQCKLSCNVNENDRIK